MSQVTLKLLPYSEATADIWTVRQAVFQIEQNVAPAVDFDEFDQTAQHIVVYADEQPVGTARIRYLNPSLAKIERVAVLSAYRRQGIGKQIMEAAVTFLDEQKVPESKVHAQSQAASFYQKLGFQPRGEEFLEAGILHIEMRRVCPDEIN